MSARTATCAVPLASCSVPERVFLLLLWIAPFRLPMRLLLVETSSACVLSASTRTGVVSGGCVGLYVCCACAETFPFLPAIRVVLGGVMPTPAVALPWSRRVVAHVQPVPTAPSATWFCGCPQMFWVRWGLACQHTRLVDGSHQSLRRATRRRRLASGSSSPRAAR
jgi:hypothetical protein